MRVVFVRVIAMLLMLSGIAGLSVSFWGAARVTGLFGELRQAFGTDHFEDSLSLTRSVSSTLGSASRAAGSGANSLGYAQASLAEAASSASDVSTSIAALARSMNLEVLGSRPFDEVVASLTRSSQQLIVLARVLDDTAKAVGANQQDVAALGQELGGLQRQTELVQGRLTPAGVSAGLDRTLDGAEQLGLVILGVFALQSGLFLAVGIALLVLSGPVRQSATTVDGR